MSLVCFLSIPKSQIYAVYSSHPLARICYQSHAINFESYKTEYRARFYFSASLDVHKMKTWGSSVAGETSLNE